MRKITLLLSALLVLSQLLSACGNAVPATGSADQSVAAAATAPNAAASHSSAPAESVRIAVRETLERAVDTLCATGTLPGFEDLLSLPLSESTYLYAIVDVDGDGYEELYLVQSGGPMAAMTALILDGQDGQLRQELCEFPLLTFYDNGYLQAGASHNQGLAGEFWPYTLYRYDAESDSYRQAALVDAWDSRCWERDYAGNAFPQETDVSGSGVVYYVADGGQGYSQGGTPDTAPMDQADYEAWLHSWQGDSREISYPLEYAIVTEKLSQAAG